jgi:hypothetical protein
MEFSKMIVALFGVALLFGIPLSAIWTQHRQKMLELQLRLHNHGDANLRNEIEALRQEVRQLRETTMQYDLSFDTALQRMEGRTEGLERRVQNVETTDRNELRGGR